MTHDAAIPMRVVSSQRSSGNAGQIKLLMASRVGFAVRQTGFLMTTFRQEKAPGRPWPGAPVKELRDRGLSVLLERSPPTGPPGRARCKQPGPNYSAAGRARPAPPPTSHHDSCATADRRRPEARPWRNRSGGTAAKLVAGVQLGSLRSLRIDSPWPRFDKPRASNSVAIR